jgi:hypothetical protein
MRKTICAAIGALMFVGTPAMAQYASIVHNMLDGTLDTSFNAGVLTINSASSQNVNLLDPGPGGLPGTVSNAVFNLTSTFNGFDGPQAQFVGGNLSLTFDYEDLDTNIVTNHEISGPITGLLFNLPALIAPGIYQIDGVGRWTATTKNLPGSTEVGGSGIWDDGGGFSSIDSLTLTFGEDLSSFDWANDVVNNGETNYQLFPNDSAVPEPTTIALLAIGAVGLIRRRR